MNKILFFLLMSLVVSCGTTKSKIQTKKKGQTTQREVYKRKVVKPNSEDIVINGNNPLSNSETLEATSKVKVTPEIVFAYIAKFKGIAKDNMVKHGIPASITLAQGILESGAGTGMLCSLANNHFGIKCHKEWAGPTVRYDDDESQECFRKYDQASQSYSDHSYFLTSRPRYASLFNLPKSNYKAWAMGLKNAGYATDPKYPDKLIGIIERYQLQIYDAEVLGDSYVPMPVKTEQPPVSNDANQHVVIQGDTLYSISKKYNVSIEDLRAKNNLIDNAISIGQSLIIR